MKKERLEEIRREARELHFLKTSDTLTELCDELESAQAEAERKSDVRAVLAPLTRAMREADEAFQREGGGTRHYLRDCLLPILERHGLEVRLTGGAQELLRGAKDET